MVEKAKDELKLKSFAECRALFDSYKRDRSVRFFSYDMNNSAQARQYFDKLLEYGINYREWQNIIKKVNEEEAAKVGEQAKEYRAASEHRESKRNEIAAYIARLQLMLEAASSELANERAYIEELKEELRKTEHQRHSADYYSVQEQIASCGRQTARSKSCRSSLPGQSLRLLLWRQRSGTSLPGRRLS